jgi:glycosyltransferase involved in cell wall biosynthesis
MRQIIYAWNYREWGGVQIYLLALMKEAVKSYDVTAVLPRNSHAKIIESLNEIGVRCHFVPPAPPAEMPDSIVGRFAFRFKVMASENRMASEIIRLAKDDETIVHIDFGFWQSLLPIYRLNRRAFVFLTQHTGLKRQNVLRDALWRIKGRILVGFGNLKYLAENNEARMSLTRYLGESRCSEMPITYTGFDPDEIEAVETTDDSVFDVRSKFGLRSGPLIVTVGQFIERKGCWTVTEALRDMLGTGTELTFLWLSTMELTPAEKERIAAYGLGDSFRVLSSDERGGSRLELLALVQASDIFVLASREEGLPYALVEAMALGRACISTRVNAIPEAIDDGVSGILIDANDSKALSTAMTFLIGDRDLREKLGVAAQDVAFARFNIKTSTAATLRLYDAVWKNRK